MNTPPPSSADGPHPLAARSDRRHFVNILTVVALGAIAASVWPTQARTLEKRASGYMEALNRGDNERAFGYLSPAAKQRVPLASWPKTPASRHGLISVAVHDGGVAGTVTWRDDKSGLQSMQKWVRIESVWYSDSAGAR